MVTRAFKEWAAVQRALLDGRQVLLLRKGGIHEVGRHFRVESSEFLLYPTYAHQQADLLRPEATPYLEQSLRDQRPGEVTISALLRVTHLAEVTDPAVVAALAGQTLWTEHYAVKRLHWKPKTPLTVLAVRAYRLATPTVIADLPAYGGCTSWIELEAPVAVDGAEPVLDESAYSASCRSAWSLLPAPATAL